MGSLYAIIVCIPHNSSSLFLFQCISFSPSLPLLQQKWKSDDFLSSAVRGSIGELIIFTCTSTPWAVVNFNNYLLPLTTFFSLLHTCQPDTKSYFLLALYTHTHTPIGLICLLNVSFLYCSSYSFSAHMDIRMYPRACPKSGSTLHFMYDKRSNIFSLLNVCIITCTFSFDDDL